MTEPFGQPAKPVDRRDLRIYVLWGSGLGLLGLLGLAILLFGSPRVWHSIWVLQRHPDSGQETDLSNTERLWHLDICTDAACRGNNLAMSTLMIQRPTSSMIGSYGRLAMGRTKDFIRYLERQDDFWLTFCLPYTAIGLQANDPQTAGAWAMVPLDPGDTGLALERLCSCDKPEVAAAARALLDFVERKYPGEIEEERKRRALK